MVEGDIMEALRASYKEVKARQSPVSFRARSGSASQLRRYLRYFMDALDIYLDIQRDRRWRRDERDDW